MKTNLFLCICVFLITIVTDAQVTQINSNKSLHVIFPLNNTKTIVVSDIDSSVWVTDATLPGTVQISAGIKYEGPFVLLSGKLIFRGSSAATGSEIFITDGTPGGTVLVKDIYNGTTGSNPAELVQMNGVVYFTAVTAAEGRELWRTDGTPGGTSIVKDIITGTDSSNSINQYHLFSAGTYLLFAAKTVSSGIELWRSDGTSAGTFMLDDINTGNAGADSSNPASFYMINAIVIFAATDATHGRELWRTDGTPGGTSILKDINTGPASSTEIQLFPGFSAPVLTGFHTFNNYAYFNAYDGTSSGEVWKTDGTPGNTSLLKDIEPGVQFPLVLVIDAVNFPDKFIFPVSDGTSSSELWVSDGSPTGTVLFKSFVPATPGDLPIIFEPNNFDVLSGAQTQSLFQGNKFFFTASTVAEGFELWVSDGTLPGTNMVKDIQPGAGNGIDINNGVSYLYTSAALFFKGTTSAQGAELWRSDGSSGGTTIVADIYTNAGSSDPELRFITNGTKIIFSATNGDDVNTDLYVVDGDFFPIPVTLLGFKVSLKAPDAFLQWTTMQEINSKDFTIQRSYDGAHFNDIGTVQAAGFSSGSKDYHFIDPEIINSNKDIIYYRLLITDKDGKQDISNVVTLRLGSIKSGEVELLTNPVDDRLGMLLSGDPGKLRILIVDVGGRKLYDNSFQNISGQLSIPVNFRAGVYFLVAESGTMRKTIKFVKQ